MRITSATRNSGTSAVSARCPHDFGDDDATGSVLLVLAASVHNVGGDFQRSCEAENRVGHGDVVINSLGQGDDVESSPVMQAKSKILLRAAAAPRRTTQSGTFLADIAVTSVVIASAAINQHTVQLVAATGAENGAADGEVQPR